MNYRIERQLTVALENQPGRLAAICRKLAEHNINIKDLAVLDNIEQGVIRLVTSNPSLTRELLVKEGHYVVEADVLMVDLRDAPGQLARLSDALARAGVNIDYAYGSEDPAEVKMRLIVKASPLGRAEEVLSKFPEA